MRIRKILEEFDREEKEKLWKSLVDGELRTDDAQMLVQINIASRKIDLLAEELEKLIKENKK